MAKAGPNDPKVPKASVVMGDFVGMIDNEDPRDIPQGAAQIQVNLCCIRIAELQVRLGAKPVIFEA